MYLNQLQTNKKKTQNRLTNVAIPGNYLSSPHLWDLLFPEWSLEQRSKIPNCKPYQIAQTH